MTLKACKLPGGIKSTAHEELAEISHSYAVFIVIAAPWLVTRHLPTRHNEGLRHHGLYTKKLTDNCGKSYEEGQTSYFNGSL